MLLCSRNFIDTILHLHLSTINVSKVSNHPPNSSHLPKRWIEEVDFCRDFFQSLLQISVIFYSIDLFSTEIMWTKWWVQFTGLAFTKQIDFLHTFFFVLLAGCRWPGKPHSSDGKLWPMDKIALLPVCKEFYWNTGIHICLHIVHACFMLHQQSWVK